MSVLKNLFSQLAGDPCRLVLTCFSWHRVESLFPQTGPQDVLPPAVMKQLILLPVRRPLGVTASLGWRRKLSTLSTYQHVDIGKCSWLCSVLLTAACKGCMEKYCSCSPAVENNQAVLLNLSAFPSRWLYTCASHLLRWTKLQLPQLLCLKYEQWAPWRPEESE